MLALRWEKEPKKPSDESCRARVRAVPTPPGSETPDQALAVTIRPHLRGHSLVQLLSEFFTDENC